MLDQWRALTDDLGPKAIHLVADPRADLLGVVVVDNIAAGAAIGGVRMAPDVTLQEVAHLARAMTLKNAAAGLAHGGAKAAIIADPKAPSEERDRRVRAFGAAIKALHEYVPGPDMGTSEHDMAIIADEGGRVAGLPAVLGGIPLDVIGATGFGLAIAAEAVEEVRGLKLQGSRVVIQGFGAVGQHAARFFADRGASIVAVSDRRGGIADPNGLDLAALVELKRSGRSVAELAGARVLSAAELVAYPCDIWIPAARPDVLTEANARSVDAKLVLQGANIPATPGAEAILEARGILVIPDFIANAGGVICAATELAGGNRDQAMAAIADKIRSNTTELLRRASETGLPMRSCAIELARTRVREAMTYRRAF